MPETTAKPPKRPAKAKTAISQGVALSTGSEAPIAPLPPHRPTDYSEKIASEICTRLTQGEPLVQMCRDEHLPHVSTIYRWLARHPDFCDTYARAREEQADTLADQIVQIADERPEVNPIIDSKTGELIRIELSSSYIAWQKNRIEARKWTAMKLRPKKYGDKLELGGDPNNPLKFEVKVEAEQNLAELVKHAELKRQAANAE